MASVAIYLLCVWVLMVFMQKREALELRWVTAGHNFLLSAGSFVMLVGTAVELHRRYMRSGSLEWFFCESPSTAPEGPLFFWSYVYYLSKYYELFDTALVLVQKSKVPHFKLQVYHHAAVIPMAWLWCEHQQSLHWGGLLFNTLVHVVMYQYYTFKVLRWPTPWKKWITKLQILQFATSFVLLAVTARYLLRGEPCAGQAALLYNCVFNATLLLQFVGVDKRNRGEGKSNGGHAKKDR